MHELTIIQELGSALDGDSRGLSPDLRAEVMREFRAGPARRDQAARRSRPVRRFALGAGVAVLAAVALLAASTVRLWGSAPAASAEAAVLLRHAATAASHAPDLAPAPDQFVYVKSVETAAVITNYSHVREQTVLREIWQSADGTRTGVLRELPESPAGTWQVTTLPGCRNGRSATPGAAEAGSGCPAVPGYHAGLPVTASAMLAYLYHHSQGQNPPDVQAFITAGDLIRESYVRPAALAAVLRAVARIPGVTVTRHATNAAGQAGVGVQQTFHGISEQLIFNPGTYAFIGERQVVVSTGAGLPIGTVMDSTAILAAGVVAHAGEFPQ